MTNLASDGAPMSVARILFTLLSGAKDRVRAASSPPGCAASGRPRWLTLFAAVCCACLLPPAHGQSLATLTVEPVPLSDVFVADALIESTRQTVIAAQVSGRVTALYVKAGDRVSAGQALLVVDRRAADQQLAAARAQAAAARAELDVSRRELDRAQTLFEKKYVSQAALDRAKARYDAASAMSLARQADARAADVESTLRGITAPYAGTVGNVEIELGSMATPGMPLVTLFDPGALRAVANMPQSRAAKLRPDAPVQVELPGAPHAERWQTATAVTILPLVDPLSDSVKIRLMLPAAAGAAARPGMFARAHFSLGAPRPRLLVPLSAIVRRTEVTALYVVAGDGSVTLRQVRVGETRGDRVEILAGLSAGERVALDPLAAARR